MKYLPFRTSRVNIRLMVDLEDGLRNLKREISGVRSLRGAVPRITYDFEPMIAYELQRILRLILVAIDGGLLKAPIFGFKPLRMNWHGFDSSSPQTLDATADVADSELDRSVR